MHQSRSLSHCLKVCSLYYPKYSALIYNEEEEFCHLGNATIVEMERALAEDKSQQEEKEEKFKLVTLYVLNPANMTARARRAAFAAAFNRDDDDDDNNKMKSLNLSKELLVEQGNDEGEGTPQAEDEDGNNNNNNNNMGTEDKNDDNKREL